jgi:hypothetical protein
VEDEQRLAQHFRSEVTRKLIRIRTKKRILNQVRKGPSGP